jgi:hypothetical protein
LLGLGECGSGYGRAVTDHNADAADQTGTVRFVPAASIALIAAAPLAAYFAVGDLSEIGPESNLDYFWREPSWMPSAVAPVGIVAVIVSVASIVTLIRAHRRRLLTRAAIACEALLVGAGFIIGGGLRVLTAGVFGAHIGAGLVILFGTPLVFTLVIAAITIGIRARRRAE